MTTSPFDTASLAFSVAIKLISGRCCCHLSTKRAHASEIDRKQTRVQYDRIALTYFVIACLRLARIQ